MNYSDTNNHDCAWRNINPPCVNMDALDQMLYDAYRLSEYNFRLLYGAYRYYGPDNSIRIVCNLKPKEVTPFIKPRAIEHKNTPRKGDLVAFVTDDEAPTYGRIAWTDMADDTCGIQMFGTNGEFETVPMDTLESINAGRLRWRVYT